MFAGIRHGTMGITPIGGSPGNLTTGIIITATTPTTTPIITVITGIGTTTGTITGTAIITGTAGVRKWCMPKGRAGFTAKLTRGLNCAKKDKNCMLVPKKTNHVAGLQAAM